METVNSEWDKMSEIMRMGSSLVRKGRKSAHSLCIKKYLLVILGQYKSSPQKLTLSLFWQLERTSVTILTEGHHNKDDLTWSESVSQTPETVTGAYSL